MFFESVKLCFITHKQSGAFRAMTLLIPLLFNETDYTGYSKACTDIEEGSSYPYPEPGKLIFLKSTW